MKLLSIDIGIKNLSFCFFDASSSENCCVQKWDNINLGEKIEQLCVAVDSTGSVCGKPSKFVKHTNTNTNTNTSDYDIKNPSIPILCYCLKHAKKMDYFLPIPELKETSLKKLKVGELGLLLNKYNVKDTNDAKVYNQNNLKKTRQEMLSLLGQYRDAHCFDIVEKTNSGKVDLVTIGENIMYKFDEIFTSVDVIDKVIIENQIGPLANKMKTIQGMISQYFIMRKLGIQIEFVNAGNKLKDYLDKTIIKSNTTNKTNNDIKIKQTEEKLTYKDRKRKSVEICKEFVLTDYRFNCWEDFFIKHTKKDDLADCFLQGMWYINKIYKDI